MNLSRANPKDWWRRQINELISGKSERLVEKTDIRRVELIPHKVTDDSVVTISRIKQFCTFEAWKYLKNAIQQLKEITWDCASCGDDIEKKDSIGCDSCLDWYHISCLGLANPPKRKIWICRKCHSSCKN
jgi:hypothetical protein